MTDLTSIIKTHEIKSPAIRSSDWGLIRRDPKLYLLSRRIGWVPAFKDSIALNRGTWFHRRCELWPTPTPDALEILNYYLDRRGEQISLTCDNLGVGPEKELDIMDRESKDFYSALAWFDAASQVPVGDHGGQTFVEFLSQPNHHLIGSEILIRFQNRIIALDNLLLDTDKDPPELWIIEVKTTAKSPRDRLTYSSIDFQTSHYFNTLKDYMNDNGGLIGDGITFVAGGDAPHRNAMRIAGVIHIAIQKPTIELSSNDRDCEEYEHTLKSGPRKGEVETRRNWEGEPKFSNFLVRCADWYLGRNKHLDRAAEVVANPPVNWSRTPAELLLTDDAQRIYWQQVAEIERYSTKPPRTDDFPPGPRDLLFGADPYKPFYLLDPVYWPSIAEREGFQVVDRDADAPYPEGVVCQGLNPYAKV